MDLVLQDPLLYLDVPEQGGSARIVLAASGIILGLTVFQCHKKLL